MIIVILKSVKVSSPNSKSTHMKTKSYFACILLFMAVVFFSCDNKETEEPDLIIDNHILVNETNIPIKGLLASYKQSSSDNAIENTNTPFPIDVYLYGSQPYFKEVSNQYELLEDSAPMIHFKLYSSVNGEPDDGEYTWKANEAGIGVCTDAWQGTKHLGFRSMPENRMVAKYEQVNISITNLKINKLDDRIYEFIVKGVDYNGAEISGYYKGSINLRQVFYQD